MQHEQEEEQDKAGTAVPPADAELQEGELNGISGGFRGLTDPYLLPNRRFIPIAPPGQAGKGK